MSNPTNEQAPHAVGDVSNIASAFVLFNDSFELLEGAIRKNANGLTDDQRLMVSRWIDSASVMVLRAQTALAGGGKTK
jgi:hypothetical protein